MVVFNKMKKRKKILKPVAFIAGKKNPEIQKFYIRFSIEIKLKKDFKGEIASKIQFRPT